MKVGIQVEEMQIIKEKIIKLKELDYNYTVFGSYKHKYKLNACLTEEQVINFEHLNNIRLPYGYREFLIDVGNGGAGPAYGLNGIDVNEQKQSRLSERFLLDEGYQLEDEEEKGYNCLLDYEFDGTCTKCDRKDFCLQSTLYYGKDTDEYRYNNGTMIIVFTGCTYYNRLVLNGKHLGEIWCENQGEGLIPSFDNFLNYYNKWLDNNLNSFLTLKQCINNKMSFNELIKLGETIFYTDIDKAKAIAGLLKIEFAKNNSLGYSSGAENMRQVKLLEEKYDEYIHNKTETNKNKFMKNTLLKIKHILNL